MQPANFCEEPLLRYSSFAFAQLLTQLPKLSQLGASGASGARRFATIDYRRHDYGINLLYFFNFSQINIVIMMSSQKHYL